MRTLEIQVLTIGHIGPVYQFGHFLGNVADVRLYSFLISNN